MTRFHWNVSPRRLIAIPTLAQNIRNKTYWLYFCNSLLVFSWMVFRVAAGADTSSSSSFSVPASSAISSSFRPTASTLLRRSYKTETHTRKKSWPIDDDISICLYRFYANCHRKFAKACQIFQPTCIWFPFSSNCCLDRTVLSMRLACSSNSANCVSAAPKSKLNLFQAAANFSWIVRCRCKLIVRLFQRLFKSRCLSSNSWTPSASETRFSVDTDSLNLVRSADLFWNDNANRNLSAWELNQ